MYISFKALFALFLDYRIAIKKLFSFIELINVIVTLIKKNPIKFE